MPNTTGPATSGASIPCTTLHTACPTRWKALRTPSAQLEFVNNRELYDWVLDALNVYHPQQIEFARLGLTYTVLSKRKLIQLVKGGFVRGWDDPRMPTICGMRRRGYTPGSHP